MRKLVIGVVAVLVLHVAFTNFMARDSGRSAAERAQSMDAIRGITPVVESEPEVYELASLWSEPAVQPEIAEPRPFRPIASAPAPAFASFKRPKNVQPHTAVAKYRFKPEATIASRPLQNTTILIKAVPRVRTEYPHETPATTVAARMDSVKNKRKSDDPLFFAVFKKPAGWIKSVASRVF